MYGMYYQDNNGKCYEVDEYIKELQEYIKKIDEQYKTKQQWLEDIKNKKHKEMEEISNER